ncbi:hypothetical protein CONLIGDRAFT_647676 [Coniochaeta ligniaria NRRL 30616]|uniref:Amidoligase enzyme n=1 Tax=Coniochaeta ligniaria NRRL 30616 TaxID=1408157 RepID=A0A1J7IXZ3_9PEZI|nr:hypothetical protein CONLIGDRAFT_647676 [Coniochaeta ligniaria NRRL 30616]
MADSPPLRFGIEIEAIFDPHYKEPGILRADFASRLVEGYEDMCSGFGDRNFRTLKWEVIYDDSLRGHGKFGPYAFEVVSPILPLDSDGAWCQQIREIFNHIKAQCKITTNETCGFHVHLSPGSGQPWSLEELRSISFAIIYFDEAILALLPQHRRNNDHLLSNFADNDKFKFFDKENRTLEDKDDDCMFAWNFGNIAGFKDTTKMTIEWRQLPGVTNSDECLGWTELALEFVQAARGWENIGVELAGQYSPDVDGLNKFVRDRGGYPARQMARMDEIFKGKSGQVKVVDELERVDYPGAYPDETV